MDASSARAASDAPTGMLSEHQRLLTGSLLRTIKASERLMNDCVRGAMRPWSWSAEIAAADINLYLAWDGNVVHRRLLEDVLRSCMAAHEHGLALFELARSPRRLSVPLAAVTRAAVEAYSRAFWLMGPQSPDECVRRLASLEFKALSYGVRLEASLRRLPHEVEATTPVSEHRERLRRWAQLHGLKLQGGDPSTLAGDFLESIYPGSGAYVYFGLSGAAHSNEWATANFYDFDAGRLRRDDKMLMEYCMYVIESSRAVCELMIRRFEPDAPAAERWTQAYAGALADIDGFINRTTD